jgi:hypothetical protein
VVKLQRSQPDSEGIAESLTRRGETQQGAGSGFGSGFAEAGAGSGGLESGNQSAATDPGNSNSVRGETDLSEVEAARAAKNHAQEARRARVELERRRRRAKLTSERVRGKRRDFLCCAPLLLLLLLVSLLALTVGFNCLPACFFLSDSPEANRSPCC